MLWRKSLICPANFNPPFIHLCRPLLPFSLRTNITFSSAATWRFVASAKLPSIYVYIYTHVYLYKHVIQSASSDYRTWHLRLGCNLVSHKLTFCLSKMVTILSGTVSCFCAPAKKKEMHNGNLKNSQLSLFLRLISHLISF